MSSTLTVTNLTATNLTDGAGTTSTFADINSGSAKAWVNFNGTGTIAARDSFNLSSLTDVSTARHAISLSSSMSSSNYSVTVFAGGTDNDINCSLEATTNHTMTASEYRTVLRQNTTNTLEDMSYVFSSIHGDLA